MCSPDIPDTSAAQNNAIAMNERIADRSLDMQDEAMDYFKERQVGLDATAKQVTDRQLAMAEETTAQGRDLYNYQKNVFRPVEESMVAQAMKESTPEFYEQFAQQAVTAQASANQNAQAQMERNLASMGVNPNSGAYADAQRQTTLENAAGLGAVANQSRTQAENLSWARKADVAGLGKGLVGAGNASYGLASGANTSALAGANQTTQTAGSTLGTGTQYGALAQQAAQGAGTLANNIYATQAQAANSGGGSGLMSIAGSALGAWASTGFAT